MILLLAGELLLHSPGPLALRTGFESNGFHGFQWQSKGLPNTKVRSSRWPPLGRQVTYQIASYSHALRFLVVEGVCHHKPQKRNNDHHTHKQNLKLRTVDTCIRMILVR